MAVDAVIDHKHCYAFTQCKTSLYITHTQRQEGFMRFVIRMARDEGKISLSSLAGCEEEWLGIYLMEFTALKCKSLCLLFYSLEKASEKNDRLA